MGKEPQEEQVMLKINSKFIFSAYSNNASGNEVMYSECNTVLTLELKVIFHINKEKKPRCIWNSDETLNV